MKEQHRTYAMEIAKGKKSIEACLIAYPNIKEERTASAAAARLNKREDIKNEIVRLRTEIVNGATAAAIEELKDEKKRLFLTMADKREILFRIAHGKMRTKTWDRNKGEYIYTYPSDDDKIKAIKLDAELTGEGFQPEAKQPEGAGNTYNNTIIKRVTMFKTNITTNRQEVTTTPNE